MAIAEFPNVETADEDGLVAVGGVYWRGSRPQSEVFFSSMSFTSQGA
jgi:hypothetical protein